MFEFLKLLRLNRFKWSKIIYLLIIATSISLTFYYYYFYNHSNTPGAVLKHEDRSFFYENLDGAPEWIRSAKFAPCDKWIIVYSVREPTENLKIISDSMYGWCLLVVGDTSTPKKWSYKDVNYLSIDDQQKLALVYDIIKMVPVNSYKRKLVGYLYAISNGARFIFETDDDVFLTEGLFRFRYEKFKGLMTSNTDTYFDPHESYFRNDQQNFSYFVYSTTAQVPVIQQGLIMKNANDYDSNIPALVLNSNQYTQLNSKNTFYHYSSFWSLMFPLEAENFLEIRSLIALRLLREIDENIAFVPTMTVSKSYEETKKELDVSLLNALDDWECKSEEFTVCFSSCVTYLAEKKLLIQHEVQVYKKWIDTLNQLGYIWPKKRTNIKTISNLVYFKKIPHVNLNKIEQLKIDTVRENCHHIQGDRLNSLKLDDLIFLTFANTLDDLDKIVNTWNLHFLYTIICYDGKISNADFLKFSNFNTMIIPIENLGFSKYQKCLSIAFNIGFRQQSFIIAKNTFDYWNYDFSKVSFSRIFYELNLDRRFLDQDFYFIRKNVANGLRQMNLKRKYDFNSMCAYYEKNGLANSLLFDGFKKSLSSLNFHTNDLAAEYCEDVKTRTIWIPDYHDGPRVDLSSTLVHLGQKPILANPKYYRSPYASTLRLSQISYSLSKFILKYVPFERQIIDLSSFRENFDYYHNLSEFEQVDAIICSFTVSLCEAFMSFNKTIILNPAHRYNIGRCSKERWTKLNENYYGLLNKSKGIVGAMSKYDQEYQAHFTGLREYRLFAYGGYYAKDVRYNPIRKEILVGPTSYLGTRETIWLEELNKFAKPYNKKFSHVRDLYWNYDLQDLANHPAIVVFPYASMTYSLVDFYIAKIPMFIPSIELFTKYKTVADRNVNYGPYCGGKNVDIEPHASTIHKYSPNNDSDIPLQYWLKYSDYFQWPFVTVFRSWSDLVEKLDTLNLTLISENMKWFNGLRESDLLENWCKILKRLNKTQMPSSYDESLKYFNMKDFQV